ncbi:MAG: hypothetical protein MJY67_01380 [Bacteroidales bacterium]|nr:hypothetical protein [Bacteroidales bacterium]
MKKTIFMAAAALLCLACQTPVQEEIVYHPTEPKGDTQIISAVLPDNISVNQTKGNLVNSAAVLSPEWAKGDQLRIKGNSEQLFSIQEGFSAKKASFEGKALASSKFTIIYPGSYKSVDEIKALNLKGQKQIGDNNSDHIKYFAYLSGVNTYEDIHFASDWAASKGGEFHQAGCIKIMAEVPDNVTSVSKASIELGEDDILSVDLEGVNIGAGHSFTAFIQTDGDVVFKEGQKISFIVVDQDGNEVKKTFVPGPQTLYGGYMNEFRIGGEWPTQFKGGKGSPSDPYLITNAEEMCAVKTLLEENAITCFKLMNDIDMSSVTDWTPINLVNGALGIDFNGNNHSIDNLKIPSGSWASIFGVVHGNIYDLTIKNASLTSSYNAPCAIVCAWAGNSTGELHAEFKNVHVVGSKVEYTAALDAVVGGFVGNACNSTFENCSFDGSVRRTAGSDKALTSYIGTGGFAGRTLEKSKLKDCYTSGEVYNAKGRATGGLVGYYTVNAAEGDIEGCHTSAKVTSVNDCTGGLIGWFAGGVFKGNWADGAEVSAGKYNNTGAYSYVGGLLGHSSTAIDLSDCHFVNGTVKASGTLAGGIIGQAQKGSSIQRCWFDGTITSTAGYVGGISSRTGDYDGYIIKDCYSRGKITAASVAAGIIADVFKGNVVSNCWSDCEISGAYGLGGLFARASNGSAASVLMGGQNFNITIKDCIAWNPSIKTTAAAKESAATHYSAGAVIGYTADHNTLQNCWRRADMEFYYYAAEGYDTLYDQDDTDATHVLYRPHTDAATDKYYFPYNGKAAAATETVKSLAVKLGWDAQVWDLTKDFPTLK